MSDWGNDAHELKTVAMTTVQEPYDLPPRLIELRDGLEPALPDRGKARQHRITELVLEITRIGDFIDDLDRYASNAKWAQLQGNAVGPYMRRVVADLRAANIAERERLRAELGSIS